MNTIKKILKSWTIWLNTTGIALLTVAMSEPSLMEWLKDNNFDYVMIIANIALRFKTNSAIVGKDV